MESRKVPKAPNEALAGVLKTYFDPDENIRGVRVGVLDSGVEADHLAAAVEPGIAIERDTGKIIRRAGIIDVMGHGTGVADVVSRLAPKCTIVPIRILDENISCTVESVTLAIEWAIDNGIDIINLSFGTTSVTQQSLKPLERACAYAAERGILLVAAQLNEGELSYPAALPSSVSVTSGEVFKPYEYHISSRDQIDFVARGNQQRVTWKGGVKRFMMGSSIACAHVTGTAAVLSAVLNPRSLDDWRSCLREMATEGEAPLIKDSEGTFVSSRLIVDGRRAPARLGRFEQDDISWIRRAALYPFNKEMHAVFRFREHLSFEIVGVGDVLTRGVIGRDPAEVIGQPPSGLKIVHRFDALFENADTLILGHLEQLSELSSADLLYRIATAAVDRGLNLFTFIEIERKYPQLVEELRKKGLHYYSPTVDDDDYWAVREELHKPEPVPEIPVLGFFGTSQSQGKFTAQIAVRSGLIKRGYRVAQIGTEPHARLFGCDFTFPIGYMSSVHLSLAKFVTFLECLYAALVRRENPEIFLFGSQGAMFSLFPNYPRSYTSSDQVGYAVPIEMYTVALLAGLKPDALILAVNAIDHPKHVGQTITMAESLSRGKVLCLILSDQKKELRKTYGRTWLKFGRYEAGELEETVRRIEKEHGLPVFVPTLPDHVEHMTDTVIDYFASFTPAEGVTNGE